MTNNLVSTIIPVYNRPEMVARAVESVLAQSHRPIEILLVDDGSTDHTPTVLAGLAAGHGEEIRVIHQANAGAGLARETGRLAARGGFIQYLDSDDLLLSNKFSDQVAALEAHPECAIAYGTSRHVHVDGRVLETPAAAQPRRSTTCSHCCWWSAGGIPTHPYSAVGSATPLVPRPPFRPEDWDLEARMGALKPRLIHCGSTVSVQVDHESDNRVHPGPRAGALRDAAIFYPRLYAAALLADVSLEAPQWQQFSDECFVRARLLHQLGDGVRGNRLLQLAELSSPGNGNLIRQYGLISRLLGPSMGARFAHFARTGRWPE